MVNDKLSLKKYIDIDREAMGFKDKNLFVEWLKGNRERVSLMNYIIQLRRFEYHTNIFGEKGGFFCGLKYLIAKHRFSFLRMKINIFISPNVFGPGLRIMHHGYYWIDGQSKIGSGCTLLPNILIGNKNAIKGNTPPSYPFIIIGDNCSIGTGSVILGPVKIGDNVVIGANSVVINDLPDNCIAAGNPAKVIKKMK